MSVLQEIEQYRPELQQLCERLGIRGLRAQLAGDDWAEVTFIGDIDQARLKGYADRFFSLEEGLVRIFHRRVHLLDEEGIRLAKSRYPQREAYRGAEVQLLRAS